MAVLAGRLHVAQAQGLRNFRVLKEVRWKGNQEATITEHGSKVLKGKRGQHSRAVPHHDCIEVGQRQKLCQAIRLHGEEVLRQIFRMERGDVIAQRLPEQVHRSAALQEFHDRMLAIRQHGRSQVQAAMPNIHNVEVLPDELWSVLPPPVQLKERQGRATRTAALTWR